MSQALCARAPGHKALGEVGAGGGVGGNDWRGGGECYGGGCSCRTQVRCCASCAWRRRASLVTPPACWPCSRPSRSRLTPNPSVSYSLGQVRACRETAAKPDEKGTPRPPRFDTGQGSQTPARSGKGQSGAEADDVSRFSPRFGWPSWQRAGSAQSGRGRPEAGTQSRDWSSREGRVAARP